MLSNERPVAGDGAASVCTPSHHESLRAGNLSAARNPRKVVNLGEPMILAECDRCPSTRPSTLAVPDYAFDVVAAARFFGFDVDEDYGSIHLAETETTTGELSMRGYFRSTLLSTSGRRAAHKRITRKGRPVAFDECRAWSVYKTRQWLARRDRKVLALRGVR